MTVLQAIKRDAGDLAARGLLGLASLLQRAGSAIVDRVKRWRL